MKYSYNWLKELSATKLSPEKLADILTMRAFELEEIKKEGKETQLVFDILANRGHDALSHIGLAREICALENRKFHPKKNVLSKLPGARLMIEIKEKSLCSRYIGALVKNVQVATSPKWMQERLLVSGVKPINNIVDITNYAMLEMGQPLHAFDADKTSGNIVVRKAKKGETIKLLDDKEYSLNENNLVIADARKALALAGVMGAVESSVTDKTTSIILESANFNPVSIRKTRVEHGLTTESSYRFERNIDPNMAEAGAARAIELLKEYGGKKVKMTALTDVYKKEAKTWTIKLDVDYVNSLLGEDIPIQNIIRILNNLDLGVAKSGKKLAVKIPTFRIDLQTQEDLIEEIGRIYGYENISANPPIVEMFSPTRNEKRIFEDKLRDTIAALGFSEMLNYSFYGQSDIEKCGLDPKIHLEVANPMNPDQQYMRTSLIPGILKNVGSNLKNFEKFSIFEIGRKFTNDGGEIKEFDCFSGAIVNASFKGNLFPVLKGKLEALFGAIGLKDARYQPQNVQHKYWHPSRTAIIAVNGEKIGKIGEVSPQVLKTYGVKSRVAVFGIKTEKILEFAKKEIIFRPLSKFPAVKRDISMFVGEDVEYSSIEKKIFEAGGKSVTSVDLFDIFEKEGERSMAIRVEIGSYEKTLTSEEIDNMMKGIIARLEKDLKVRVRK